MKLKHCVVLTVVAFLLIQCEIFGLWLPLVGVIQNLSGGQTSRAAHVPVPAIWHLLINPWFGTAVLALALASVIGTIVGLRRETGSKVGWVVVLVFGLIVLFFAAPLPFVLPKFAVLFRDMGIK